jgi:release factor glutamine methyltransferase
VSEAPADDEQQRRAPTASALLIARLRGAGCVFAEDEAALLVGTGASGDELERLVARRVAGEPLELVLGWAEFDGLRVRVAPGVFVPRRRSELLVRVAVSLIDAQAGTPVVVDLCCGTGALGAAVARRVPAAVVHAADLDPDAVACARSNLPPERVHAGDLFDALPTDLRGRVDLVVVNAPYVPTDAIALMPPEARDHEHRIALDGGEDGLALHRRIASEVQPWLSSHGGVVIETSERQAPQTAALFAATGLAAQVVRDDDLDSTAVLATT